MPTQHSSPSGTSAGALLRFTSSSWIHTSGASTHMFRFFTWKDTRVLPPFSFASAYMFSMYSQERETPRLGLT